MILSYENDMFNKINKRAIEVVEINNIIIKYENKEKHQDFTRYPYGKTTNKGKSFIMNMRIKYNRI